MNTDITSNEANKSKGDKLTTEPYTVASAITIQRPIAEVFDYIATMTNWGIIHPTMKMFGAPDHPAQVGESAAEKIDRGPIQAELLWTVTESTPLRRWVLEGVVTKQSWLYKINATKMTYQYTKIADGTRVELRLTHIPKDFLAKIINFFLERFVIRPEMPKTLAHLKHILESENQGDPHHHSS